MPLPALVWNRRHQLLGDRSRGTVNASEQEERDILATYCALNAEYVVYSLGIIGLALDGMTKVCNANSVDFSQLQCGGFTTALLSEAAWVASAASTMPETCGLVELEGADCAADSTLFVANTFQLAADGIAAKGDCFEDESEAASHTLHHHHYVGQRKAGQSGSKQASAGSERGLTGAVAGVLRPVAGDHPSPGAGPAAAAPASALEALGLVGKKLRRSGGGWRGPSSTSASSAGTGTRPADGPEDGAKAEAEEKETEFTRGFDVAVCYFLAENSASTAIDTALSILTAVKVCEKFERTRHKEHQEECAAIVANILSDLGTLVANVAFMASACPVEPPPSKVPCVGDWADAVVTLSNWAVWGASFGPDCLRRDETATTGTTTTAAIS